MKHLFLHVLFGLILFQIKAQDLSSIIPLPLEIKAESGAFKINESTSILDLTNNSATNFALRPLLSKLRLSAGISLAKVKKATKSNQIVVTFDKQITHNEGYSIIISPTKVQIKAANASGVFYAIQSILQLLPAEIEHQNINRNLSLTLPAGRINDAPRFGYRGIMLDVSRHFMPTTFIKKYIDELASLKINRFHWHLTDGQAFRFESKKYPLLHKAKSPQWPTNEGFYTQNEMREIVKYASERFITVIPEFDVPAHTNALLVAYPQFGCLDSLGKTIPLQGELCPKQESVAFVNEILDEIMTIFPSKYIHIGGDEASKNAWHHCPNCQKSMKEKGLNSVDELQSEFIKSLEKHVNSKGRKIIGWDEILDGGLAPNATVMAWRNMESGEKAANMSHEVIMSPTSHCYLDYYQSEDPNEPLAFGGYINLPKIYSFEPVPTNLPKAQEKYILGGQANLWTEQVPVPSHAEYMTFPRSIALAEVVWSAKEARNYTNFMERLSGYLTRMDYRQVNYAKHFFEIKTTMKTMPNGSFELSINCDNGNAPIYYTTDGTSPSLHANIYKDPIVINKSTVIKAATVMKGKLVDEITRNITYNKATGKVFGLESPPSKYYNKGGIKAITNGLQGGESRYNDEEWLGWNNADFNGILDFGKNTEIEKISLRFFHKPSSWIWMPTQVSIWGSNDGSNFTNILSQKVEVPENEGVLNLPLSFQKQTVKYLKIIAKTFGTIPPNSTGAGDKAWLFVDEVVVE